MKKRVITIVLAAAMALTACSSNGSNRSSSISDSNDEEIEETEDLEDDVVEQTWVREGEFIIFGQYEQDGDEGNGAEPIEWEIVKEEDGRMLLISRYILDAQPYNTGFTDVTWETCSLREWLNDDFINTAFDESEQEQILIVTNTNPDNARQGTEGGNDTEDRVFCLSLEEIIDNYEFDEWNEEYQFGSSLALRSEVTQYAIEQGTTVNETGCGGWWLRSPGYGSGAACNVNYYGTTGWGYYFSVEDDSLGVRPAIYLSVE